MSARGRKAAAPKKKASGYKMPPPIPAGEVISNLSTKNKWRIGPSIGVGGFGEIYSACNHNNSPKKESEYPLVIKIEPNENGPLFVEMHFYIKNANKDDIANFMKEKKLSTFGMPTYHGNGIHTFKGEKYRYLVLERYGKDLWSVFTSSGQSFPTATVCQIGLQMLDVLEYIHSRGYVHADIKGANILLGLKKETENQTYLVDFGLATRVKEKEFKPDPKCAHNGTIEYTSRDAHLGVPTMRGDLEILGYNMLQWIVGELPWEKVLSQPKTVQGMKEAFMKDVRAEITKKFNNVPDQLIKFFEYINSLKPIDPVDHSKCRQMFESYLKTQRKTKTSKLEFGSSKRRSANKSVEVEPSDEPNDESGDETPVKVDDKKKKRVVKQNGGAKPKRSRRRKDENTEPDKNVSLGRKRKSVEPSYVVKVKRTKMAPRATPPTKQNHSDTATQTSGGRPKRDLRQVTFDSPICAVIGDNKDTSGDMFDDSFVSKDIKVKPKRRLLSEEEVTVKRVIRRKVTTAKAKGKSWRNTPAILNGRSPPKC